MPQTEAEARSPLEEFDAALQRVTDGRVALYSHPYDGFPRIRAMQDQIAHCPDPRARHVLEMLCVKMARLAQAPDHLDSWIDVAGYARTAVMCIERGRGAPADAQIDWERVRKIQEEASAPAAPLLLKPGLRVLLGRGRFGEPASAIWEIVDTSPIIVRSPEGKEYRINIADIREVL